MVSLSIAGNILCVLIHLPAVGFRDDMQADNSSSQAVLVLQLKGLRAYEYSPVGLVVKYRKGFNWWGKALLTHYNANRDFIIKVNSKYYILDVIKKFLVWWVLVIGKLMFSWLHSCKFCLFRSASCCSFWVSNSIHILFGLQTQFIC